MLQGFRSVTNLVATTNVISAQSGTSETVLVPTLYTGIAANETYPGKVWELNAGGIMSFASTGILVITPRVGLTIGGITLGASPQAVTTPGATTNMPWYFKFRLICRTLGLAGANSTFVGNGVFHTVGTGSAGTAVVQTCGGLVATADATIATGLWIGWTLSVSGSFSTQWATFESLN